MTKPSPSSEVLSRESTVSSETISALRRISSFSPISRELVMPAAVEPQP